MAISSQSDNKAGAWQFVKSYFSEDSQKNTSRFAVIQKYFDDIINNDMELAPPQACLWTE